MEEAAVGAAQAAGWQIADIDRFVFHQANARITQALATRLGIAPDRVPTNIRHVGNTSAASIPLLLDEAARSGRLLPGHRVLLCAFGAGLAWAATALVWPRLEQGSDS
jgi:3-oxoacyl-[acyl-carrier-protein] synthase-3